MMKYILILLATITLMTSALAVASESAVSAMAGMVMQLNHYPTATEKAALANITTDAKTTTGEKTLAGALMRMQHRVGGADSTALQHLSADSAAKKSERELADILLGIAHKASVGDIKRLKALRE